MFVISDKELERLSAPALSNEARAVYLLSIRPGARCGKAVLNLAAIEGFMFCNDDTLQDYLFELIGQGLIERRKGVEGLFEDGETVFLPAADRSRRIFLSS